MATVGIIISISIVIWFIIDRFKPLWTGLTYGKYITLAVSCILGMLAVITFQLDILYAAGIVPEITTFGQICTTLLYMAGSSAFAELIERLKK